MGRKGASKKKSNSKVAAKKNAPGKRAIQCCKRCEAHGLEIPKKDHKLYCDYKDCSCEKCIKVEEDQERHRIMNKMRREKRLRATHKLRKGEREPKAQVEKYDEDSSDSEMDSTTSISDQTYSSYDNGEMCQIAHRIESIQVAEAFDLNNVAIQPELPIDILEDENNNSPQPHGNDSAENILNSDELWMRAKWLKELCVSRGIINGYPPITLYAILKQANGSIPIANALLMEAEEIEKEKM